MALSISYIDHFWRRSEPYSSGYFGVVDLIPNNVPISMLSHLSFFSSSFIFKLDVRIKICDGLRMRESHTDY